MTRFLVVDDHELLRRGLRCILNGAFPELVLVETTDAKAVLEAAGKEPCDLAFVDINLPGRNGLDLPQDLRRLTCGG